MSASHAAPTTAVQHERYRCPVTGKMITLGVNAVRLRQPMVLAPKGRRHPAIAALITDDTEMIDRCAGRVFGPGCVVAGTLLSRRWWPYLLPAPADHGNASMIVNETQSAGPAEKVGEQDTSPATGTAKSLTARREPSNDHPPASNNGQPGPRLSPADSTWHLVEVPRTRAHSDMDEEETPEPTISQRCRDGQHDMCRGRVYVWPPRDGRTTVPCDCEVCQHPRHWQGRPPTRHDDT